jgi:predicted NBD/HSP70 family sugar kinase
VTRDSLLEELNTAAAPCLSPPFDSGFRPAACWARAYRSLVRRSPRRQLLRLVVVRPDGSAFHRSLDILPWSAATEAVTYRHVERTLKYLLWQKGGNEVQVSGCDALAARLAAAYAPGGERAFDADMMGPRLFGAAFRVRACPEADLTPETARPLTVGGNWNGCRVGFDLGGSDRKCAAVIDGKVVHTEEVPWSPVTAADWRYHRDGIQDSIRRAAAHLPRIDAIGGSAAGAYVNNEVRVASLFRAIPQAEFDRHIHGLFVELGADYGVPLVVMNDGDVTALAGAMSLNDQPVLGMAFGTSLAGGYCGADGGLTPWLNELAFVPVDYRDDAEAPRDEWSGDTGCGALYLSQQAVGRLASAAGVEFPAGTGLPERLAEMQRRLAAGDGVANDLFVAVGRYLGYAIAHDDDFYELKHVLALGRVTSGTAGGIIVREAQAVLATEFPEVAARVRISMPDETSKRHGQAVVAASLPQVMKGNAR